MSAFQEAIESGDPRRVAALMSPDVVFHSPVIFKPYEGAEVVTTIIEALAEVLQDFRVVAAHTSDDATWEALRFTGRINDLHLDGCDFVRCGPDGLVVEIMVMMRPVTGLVALAEAMRERMAPAPQTR